MSGGMSASMPGGMASAKSSGISVDWGRVIGAFFGFLISIPAFFLSLAVRFVSLGCGIFHVKQRSFPPKALVDPELGTHRYLTINGVKLHYVESGRPDGPLMLLVHGFPQFWYSWRHQIRHFKATHRVVAVDMRGYNESGKPEGIEPYQMEELVGDLRGLVVALGADRCTLVAHDWGAAVAWAFAALHPELLSGLVILNMPHLLALLESRGKTWDQALKSWYIIFFQCPVLPELGMMSEDMDVFKRLFKGVNSDHETLEAYKYAFKDFTSWNRPLNYYRMTTTKRFKNFLTTNKEKFRIDVPTLQIFGTADTALSVGAARAGGAWLGAGRLELLEGVSHWVQEEEPDRVNSLIDEFLAEK
jgi:pimeloyl-ACP methyl ester carboxylesterase